MNLKTLLLVFVFGLACFVRFYALGAVPDGLAQDETSIGYNAYSLLQTGKDEYGQAWPVTFKAFGEYKLPEYIYLAAPSISVFGVTPFAVRLPAALFGFLTVIIFYLLLKKITNNDWLALLSTLLLALNPWHIHFSRGAFEVVPALFFLLFGTYLFVQFIDTKHYLYLILSGSFFVFSLYTYNTCRVLAPVLFLLLVFFYRKKIVFTKVNLWLSTLPPLLLLLPFFVQVIWGTGFTSVQGTLLYASAPIQAEFIMLREIMFAQDPYFSRLFFNRWFLNFFEYLKHILLYFSPAFLFVSGSEHGNHGIGNIGMLYLFEFITILVGVCVYIRKPKKWLTMLLLWGISVILVAAFTREAPHGTRGFFLIPTLISFSAYGLFAMLSSLPKLSMPLRITALILGAFFISINLVYYFSSYYFRFPLLYGKNWRSQDNELVDYLRANEQKYNRIIFDEKAGLIYTSLLYYLPYDPATFQKEVMRGPDDSEGFSKVHAFGKYSFGGVDWEKAQKSSKTLIITLPEYVPSGIKTSEVFTYPKRPFILVDGQKMSRPPLRDFAYVVVELPQKKQTKSIEE